MYAPFLDFITQLHPLSAREQATIASKLAYRELPARYRMVETGKKTHEFFFMLKGCARLFYEKDGEELTGFFFTENMFFGALHSFLAGTTSDQSVECLEDCAVAVIGRQALDEMYEEVPKLNIVFRKVLEQRLVHAQKVVASFILKNPEERYLDMLTENQGLFNRIPQHMLATFLGITPVSLSRIRKRIAVG